MGKKKNKERRLPPASRSKFDPARVVPPVRRKDHVVSVICDDLTEDEGIYWMGPDGLHKFGGRRMSATEMRQRKEEADRERRRVLEEMMRHRWAGMDTDAFFEMVMGGFDIGAPKRNSSALDSAILSG